MTKQDCYFCGCTLENTGWQDPDGPTYCSKACQRLYEEGSFEAYEDESFIDDDTVELEVFNRRNNPNE